MDHVKRARQVIDEEIKAIEAISGNLDDGFNKCIETILASRGRVAVTAVGKSGHIGRKIAATLASTGTPAYFIHAYEGFHGDLGMVSPDDVVIAISNSGETEEIVGLIPIFKKTGMKIMVLSGNPDSTLSRQADICIHAGTSQEADSLNLAPTSSTTAALVMGDAIAVALMEAREFSAADFAKYHPGGNLGRSLMRVGMIMHSGKANPVVSEGTDVRTAINEIASKWLGAVNVIDDDGMLKGILTDGNLRRFMSKSDQDLLKILNSPVSEVMTRDPIAVNQETLCTEAIKLMEIGRGGGSIFVLPVVDNDHRVVGMLRLHDLVQAGFSLEKPIEEL